MSKSNGLNRRAQAARIRELTKDGKELEQFFYNVMIGDLGERTGAIFTPAPIKERMYAANWLDERMHGKLPDTVPDPFDGLSEEEMLTKLRSELDRRTAELKKEKGDVV